MSLESLPLDPAIVQKLSGVTTATLTTVLLKKGLRNVWIRAPGRFNRVSRVLWGGPSPCALCPHAKTWPRPHHGLADFDPRRD